MHAALDDPPPVPYATFWQRFAASVIDWIICYVALYAILLPLTLLARGDARWWVSLVAYIPVAVIPIAYFTFFLARGQSLGMQAVGIRIVRATTGQMPGRIRAFVKACFAVIFYLSILPLASSGFEGPEGGYDTVDLAIIYSILALFAGGLLARFWMIWDRRGQTLVDKVAGVVVAGA
jgi:uncharacterized RDD family membrane protein YckC